MDDTANLFSKLNLNPAPEGGTSQSLKESGNAHYRAGRYEEALQDYARASQLDNKDPSLYGNLASAYMMLGKFEEAIVACDQAVERSDERGRVRFLLRKIRSQMHLGDLDEATVLMEGLVNRGLELEQVGQTRKLLDEAKALSASKNLSEWELDRLQELCSVSPDLQVQRVQNLMKTNNEAALLLMQTFQSRDSVVEVLLKARLLLRLDRGPEVDRHLARHAERPEIAEFLASLRKKRALLASLEASFQQGVFVGETSRCLNITTELLQDDTDEIWCGKAWPLRAKILHKAGKSLEALGDVNKAIASGAKQLFLLRAQIYVDLKLFELAQKEVADLFRKKPHDKQVQQLRKTVQLLAKYCLLLSSPPLLCSNFPRKSS